MNKQYVVGFVGKEQTVIYSNDVWESPNRSRGGSMGKMTLAAAKKELKTLSGPTGKTTRAIFKLVPVYKEKL